MICCGMKIPEAAGKYGCPNCEGEYMNKKDMRGTGSKENVGRKKGVPTKTAAVRLPAELIEEHGINDTWLKDAVQMKIDRQLIKPDIEAAIKVTSTLQNEAWSLICENCDFGDDSSFNWLVVGYYMATPKQRVLGHASEGEGIEKAVQMAIETTKADNYAYLYEYQTERG